MKNLSIAIIMMFCMVSYQEIFSQNRMRKNTPTTSPSETNTKVYTKNRGDNADPDKVYQKPMGRDKTFWFSQVDFEAVPISTDTISYINIYGALSANFFIGKLVYLGPVFTYKFASTHDYQVLPYEGKNLDISSLNEWSAGFQVGFDFFDQTRIVLSPELRTSFSQYNIQDVAFNDTNGLFINHNFIAINPRLNFGVRISDYSSIGINAGYKIAAYIKGSKNDFYNPQSFNLGLFFRFSLSK